MPLVSELLERFEASDGAKTRFLNYCFDVRDTLQRRDLQDRFKAGQKERIEALLQATQELLNSPSSVFGTEQDVCGMQGLAARSPHPNYAGGLPSSRCS